MNQLECIAPTPCARAPSAFAKARTCRAPNHVVVADGSVLFGEESLVLDTLSLSGVTFQFYPLAKSQPQRVTCKVCASNVSPLFPLVRERRPGKGRDYYHTCYCLSGKSMVLLSVLSGCKAAWCCLAYPPPADGYFTQVQLYIYIYIYICLKV